MKKIKEWFKTKQVQYILFDLRMHGAGPYAVFILLQIMTVGGGRNAVMAMMFVVYLGCCGGRTEE